jgi:hypothetical protein
VKREARDVMRLGLLVHGFWCTQDPGRTKQHTPSKVQGSPFEVYEASSV